MGKDKKHYGESSESFSKVEEPKKEAKSSKAVPPRMIRLPNGSVVQVNK